MAIEASAKKAHLSGKEMHDRLKRQGLIHKRLLRHYEQLHTQSLDWVVDDTLETLHNWEQEEKENEPEKLYDKTIFHPQCLVMFNILDA